jgi:hypothetical protein
MTVSRSCDRQRIGDLMDTSVDQGRSGPAGAKARQGLTDAKLRDMPPRERAYKVSDGRNGLYVLISPSGSRSFRYDYRFGGRRDPDHWSPRACGAPGPALPPGVRHGCHAGGSAAAAGTGARRCQFRALAGAGQGRAAQRGRRSHELRALGDAVLRVQVRCQERGRTAGRQYAPRLPVPATSGSQPIQAISPRYSASSSAASTLPARNSRRSTPSRITPMRSATARAR